jgi:hypothetical protein
VHKWPLHPILIAAYPVTALLGSNIGQIEINASLRSLALAALLGISLLVAGKLFLSDWHRAAFIASLSIILLFSYGHLYGVLKQVEIGGIIPGRHRYLVPVFAIVMLLGLRWVRRLAEFGPITPWLNALGLLWLVIPLSQIARFELQVRSAPEPNFIEMADVGEKRDIYYIVLDAYTRQDVLREVYGVDISPFREKLEQQGFFFAECSLSNYSQTDLGFAATLNLNYLDQLGTMPKSGNDRSSLFFLIRENEVRRILEENGYVTFAFETGFAWSEWRQAHIFMGPDRSQAGGGIRLNAFETLLIRSTALIVLLDAQTTLLPDINDPIDNHRERVLHALEWLPNLPDTQEPKFVFAHIVAPHKPYLFGPAPGEEIKNSIILPDHQAASDVVGYRNQIVYLNERIPAILQEIIDEATKPPIIILQGDHGADEAKPEDRVAILNALYLPQVDDEKLYAFLSPVNTFRLIFQSYFGWDSTLLPDQSFFSTYAEPFRLQQISRACNLE